MHHLLMFEVTAVRRGLLSKVVELTAREDIVGSKTLLGGRGLTALPFEYRYPLGAKLTLRFAPWKRVQIGDHIDVATVLKHPSVEDEMFRNARG